MLCCTQYVYMELDTVNEKINTKAVLDICIYYGGEIIDFGVRAR